MSEPLHPDLEQNARDLAARIRSRSESATLDMARRLVATTADTLFGDTAFAPRDHALGLVADADAEHLPQKSGYTGSAVDGPHGGRPAQCQGCRDQTVGTLGGPVRSHRAYDYGGTCGRGSCPRDGRVGLTDHRLSPAAERPATRCGAVADSFEMGADLRTETAGTRPTESTVRRTTTATGVRIAGHPGTGPVCGGKQAWDG